MAETAGQRKVIGAIWLISAVVSLGAAFVVQPVSDWGFFGYLIAAAMVLLGVTVRGSLSRAAVRSGVAGRA